MTSNLTLIALSGIIMFALGSTLVLFIILAELSNSSQFGYNALGDGIAVFLGTLAIGFGLYQIIRAAVLNRSSIAA